MRGGGRICWSSAKAARPTYYMTLTWMPPQPLIQRGLRYFIRGPGHPAYASDADDLTASARTFVRHADFLMDLLKGMLAIGCPADQRRNGHLFAQLCLRSLVRAGRAG